MIGEGLVTLGRKIQFKNYPITEFPIMPGYVPLTFDTRAPGEQAMVSSCPVTIAATVDLRAWEDTEEPSKDENQVQRDAAPYPQLPMGYDQTYFGIEEGSKPTPLYAPPDACASSDATAEQMQALVSTSLLLTVQVMLWRPCRAWLLQCLKLWGICSNAPSMHPSAQSCAICARMEGSL